MTAPDMLAQYRATVTPQTRELVESFKKMSLAERDELLFYTIYMLGQNYAALLRLIHGMGMLPEPPGQGDKPN